jgi:spore coat-associated protein N
VSGALRASRVWRVLLTLLVLAVLAITLQSLRLSGASYAAASANPANVFVAGSLSHTNDQNGQVMFVASDLEPGDSRDGTMTLTGTGTVSGSYTLSASSLANVPASPPLSGKLNLTIEDVTGTPTTLWEGTVAAFASTDLGDIAPEVSRAYRITLDYPDGADDSALQGATMTLVLRVEGVSP